MKRFFLLTCVFIIATVAVAQDRNNEDEVIKLDSRFSMMNAVEGELLVKFADDTQFGLQTRSDKGLNTTGIASADAVLRNYSEVKMERLCPQENPTRQLRTSRAFNGPDVRERDLSRLCKVKITETTPGEVYQLIDDLKALPEVEFAEPNYIISVLGSPAQPALPTYATDKTRTGNSYFDAETYTNEPMYSMQWGLQAVNLPQLWAADTSSNTQRPIIAILDTGVDTEHPDLADNIWTNPNETANGYDDDNNGYADDLHGWDFVNQTAEMNDFNSHGTHCAGIAAAVGNNGIGITGANPNALIMPIAVMQSNGTGDIATIIKGINYAKNNGANVLSMSFGTYAYSIALEQALAQAYQTMILVAAAGNDGMGIDPRCSLLGNPMYPAAFTFVLAVQATGTNVCDIGKGLLACFSNYDCDGPTFTQYGEEQMYNYEVSAPGVGITSTVPGGQYRAYNGTSMACPLVAGGVSALMHAKPYPSQEMLWGDLINRNTEFQHIDFMAVYNAGPAPAQLQCVTLEFSDTTSGDGDMRPDAGETIELYPTIRTTWGAAEDIKFWLTFDEFEDTRTINILTDTAEFVHSLSAYAKSKSANPVSFKVDSSVVDGRNINLVLNAACPNSEDTLRFPFTITVENGVELGGMITENTTLYPNVHYIVTSNLAVPDGVTLTIKPGTVLKFKDDVGLSVSDNGYLSAKGTADSLIYFTKTDLGQGWSGLKIGKNDSLSYCHISNVNINYSVVGKAIILNNSVYTGQVDNLVLTDNHSSDIIMFESIRSYVYNVNIHNNIGRLSRAPSENLAYCNIANNTSSSSSLQLDHDHSYKNCNVINYYYSVYSTTPIIVTPIQMYFGSNNESIIRSRIYDIETTGYTSFGYLDISERATRPHSEAHGIVWKVVVNGYDAQDEFEFLPPLGIGTHEFKIYFNRAMDVSVDPMIAMGVRPPYTQHAISEKGQWSADSTIYTVNYNLKATDVTDGLNRIYVANARDNEHFEIPYENQRFNVQIATTGSMSTGFQATAGLGKIDLEWNHNDVNFDDFLGYNMYRYQLDTAGNSSDTIKLNRSLLNDTLFTDFDVIPGERYHYFYRVMRTNLSEINPSRVVSCIPLSAERGDANGDFNVNVVDVVTTVAYITGQNPQPFIFDATDVNGDGTVNVLDIVGIINIIANPGSSAQRLIADTAIYYIEDGILYVETPVDLAGVQVNLFMDSESSIEVLEALSAFEQVQQRISDSEYLFMAYSMSGQKLTPGRHALLRIGDAGISDIVLSDPMGREVHAQLNNTTGIESYDGSQLQMGQPYPNPFTQSVTIPYFVGKDRTNNIEFVIVDVTGNIVDSRNLGSQTSGQHTYTLTVEKSLPSGIYFVIMRADGIDIQRAKIVSME